MADKLTDAQIEAIARRVQGQLRGGASRATGATRANSAHPQPAPQPGAAVPPHLSYVGRAGRAAPAPATAGRDGIYPDLDSAVAAARQAFRLLDDLSLEKRFAIVAAMRETMRRNAELLATMAAEETGLGRAEDKVKKNLLVIEKTPGPEVLQPSAWTGDRGLTLVERAPYGVPRHIQ